MKQFETVAIQLNVQDNVAIAKQTLDANTMLAMPNGTTLTLTSEISAGHKFALRPIAVDEPVLRYGYSIGVATHPINIGDWVHTHNMAVGKIEREYTYRVVEPIKSQPSEKTFLGYRRADDKAGTRNYIAVISTVNCSAHVATEIARAFTPEKLAAFPNIDGVIPLVHHSGCSSSLITESRMFLRNTIANIARNPNIGGYVYLGLGCEGNQVSEYCDAESINPSIELLTPYPIGGTGMVVQDQGGFRKTVTAGIAAIEKILPQVNATARTPQPISALALALQCGGSDSWSGVTANPLVGLVADYIVRHGGIAVLSETPEIFGAEHLLLQRAANTDVAQKLIRRFKWWNEQARLLNFTVDNNPSPGNKKGGLTTIFEKSLGAAAKGGSTPLNDVYEYAEWITSRGFVFMDTPGYDPVSVTGQLAGGCNMILFTTGRGSVFGSNVAPCIKIATNSTLYHRMSDDMDFNAGRIIEGESMAHATEELIERVIRIASGEKSKSEEKGLPEYEFIPWQPGPTI